MTTDTPTRLLTGTIDLGPWLAFAGDGHLDPYTVWALWTRFRQFFKNGELTPVLDFLVELHHPLPPDEVPFADLQAKGWPFHVPPVYQQPMPGRGGKRSCHITVRLETGSGEMSKIGAAVLRLIRHPTVKRAQLGFPRPLYPRTARPVAPGSSPTPAPHTPAQPYPLLLGLLDDGCPFAHEALRDEHDRTRVLWLWDQTSRVDVPQNAHDDPPAHMGYGRVRTAQQLQTVINAHRHGGLVEEEAVYQDPRSLQAQPVTRSSHAASVIGLLAGRQARRPRHTRVSDIPAADDDIPGLPPPQPEDAASLAPLAVVQFPGEQINVAGARWLMVRALDGLRYLATASATLRKPESPLPLVVNLSYGGVASAHDGTGLLETAIDELVTAHEQMAVVMAAGNSFGTARVQDQADALQRRPSGRHFEHLAWTKADGPTGFSLYVPPHKPIETYLEIWFDQPGAKGAAFVKDDEVTLEVQPPFGPAMKIGQWPDAVFAYGHDDVQQQEPTAALIALPRVAQSRHRSMALLVVAATRMSTSRVEVAAGPWRIRLCNQGQRSWNIRAWVERDVIPGESARRQSARLSTPLPGCGRLTDEDVLNSTATGQHVLRAGALLARLDESRQPRVSAYSASAAPGARTPEFSAVADESPSRPGIRTTGMCSGAIARANGTSLSAPQAARWIAEQLASGRSLSDIQRDLSQRPEDLRRGRIWV